MGVNNLKKLLHLLLDRKLSHGIKYYDRVDQFVYHEKNKNIATKCSATNPLNRFKCRQELSAKPLTVCIDGNLYAARYKRVFKKIEYGFLRQILQSLASGILPIYVFDGTAPESKHKVIQNRKAKRQRNQEKLNDLIEKNNSSFDLDNIPFDEIISHVNKITKNLEEDDSPVSMLIEDHTNYLESWSDYLQSEASDSVFIHTLGKDLTDEEKLKKKSVCVDANDLYQLKKFLDMLNIPFLTAKGEADDLMVFLYKNSYVTACQSDDMDLLPKGCENLIQINNNGVTQYNLPDILSEIKLSRESFIDMCILLGTDYYRGYLPRLKAHELYNIFLENPSIEEFVEYYQNIDKNIGLHTEKYIACREYFNIDANTIDNIELISNVKNNLHDLRLFSVRDIKSYFISNGITLDINSDIKIINLIQKANNELSKIPTHLLKVF